jgi:putative ABC transport system ATP-binding protein
MSLIVCRDLVKTYRLGEMEVRALRGISLTIEAGEFVAIMGASGSGKSTLMNILGCLDIPTSGTYMLEGTDVSTLGGNSLAEARNKKIGFVFQSFNLIARTTARENVQLPLFYRGISSHEQRTLALRALERVGLAEREKHNPAQLSGGQQQRVAIARALVTNPSIILADEPTGNLDSLASREIMDTLTQLNREGMTVILVTHEEDNARYAGRIVMVKDGIILYDRPSSEMAGARLVPHETSV